MTAEQKARNMLRRMGIDGAQNFTAGNVVELANFISAYRAVVTALDGLMFLEDWASPRSAGSIGEECPEAFEKAHVALSAAKRLTLE